MILCQFMQNRALAAILCGTIPALGWGPEGHSLIARIAEAQLTPAVHAKVAEILGPNVTMASVASWPDGIRRARPETGQWHYIDIPIDQPHLDMARDCPKGDCVIKKIEDFEVVLHDPNTPAVQRREALMFLIHFVGDMHQPLHDSDNKDKGGNDVHVTYNGRNMNLHSLWDSGLLGHMGKEDELFPVYSADSERHAKKWAKGSVEDWAEQAHKLAVKVTYGKLPKADKSAPVTITAEYEAKADPLIREQIEKAGARLARVVNETLQ
jgi:hypothetical protein